MRNEVYKMIIRPEEWIVQPDENGIGILKAWAGSGVAEFPLPIETHGLSEDDVALHEEQDFGLILECAQKPKVYLDEVAYESAGVYYSIASESVIPVGLFPATDDPEFVRSARILLNGNVIEICEDPTEFGFDKGDLLYRLTCLGDVYDAVLPAELADGIKIKEGNIVSCVYWVQGWPWEDE